LCETLPPLATLEERVRAVLLTSDPIAISKRRVDWILGYPSPGCSGIIQRLFKNGELEVAGQTDHEGASVNLYSITATFAIPEPWRGNSVNHHPDLIERVKAIFDNEYSPRTVKFVARKLGYGKSGPVRSVVMKLVRQGWLVPVGEPMEGSPRSYLKATNTRQLQPTDPPQQVKSTSV
jgi:hypothetical protein